MPVPFHNLLARHCNIVYEAQAVHEEDIALVQGLNARFGVTDEAGWRRNFAVMEELLPSMVTLFTNIGKWQIAFSLRKDEHPLYHPDTQAKKAAELYLRAITHGINTGLKRCQTKGNSGANYDSYSRFINV